MSKRPSGREDHHSHKRQKHDHHNRPVRQDQQQHTPTGPGKSQNRHLHGASRSLPAAASSKPEIASYVPLSMTATLPRPDLPALSPRYAQAPFRHASQVGYDRTSTAGDLTYERLEFLGDAYIEVIAIRLMFHHFPNLTAGRQSQIRELLVKNETLAEYATAYGFDEKLNLADQERLFADAKNRGNKGLNKILGDSFEAYVAALILGDAQDGFARAEKWLLELWSPKVMGAVGPLIDSSASGNDYNPTAKAELQQKIMCREVKLEYEAWKPTVELKGDKIGQNVHFMALYLTGHGHVRKLLGKGEGSNKVEAGNRAAMEAMNGETKELVEEYASELAATREKKRKEKEEAEKAAAME